MPWTDLDGRSVVLADLLTPTVQYERDGADLSRRRYHPELPAVGTGRRRSRLLDVGLHDLADERSPRHVESAVNGAGQRTGVVLEDLDHQRSVVGENHAGLLHAEQARLTLSLAERARGIDSNVGVIALAERGDRREGGANLERNAGKDQLLASGRLDGGRDFRIVPRVDRGAIDDVLSSHHFHEFGEGRPPHAVAGRGGDNGWDP